MATQARFLTLASLRWVIRHRAWTPWYLVRYWRFAKFKLRNPHVITEGFVFLGRGVTLEARRGYGRLILGRWVHIGSGNSIRCHEGTIRIGDKCVFGKDNTVNGYLDIEFGAATIVADWVYVCDFDHVFADVTVPIKDQGIVKTPVRVGPDVWLGTKVTVLRGITIGRGRGERGGEQGPPAVLGRGRDPGPGRPGPGRRPRGRRRPAGRAGRHRPQDAGGGGVLLTPTGR